MAQLVMDREFFLAALIGYEAEKNRVIAKIAELQKQLGRPSRRVASAGLENAGPTRKHHISAEGRQRIREAQKKRWAAAKKQAQSKA